MPEVITIEEARRRAAVAHMIIAECDAFAALNDGRFADEGERPAAVWHCKQGYVHHPVKYFETAKDAVEAGEITREEIANALGVDLAEVDAENDRDRDRISPSTWTTLPEGFDVAWPYDVTDPEDTIVADADKQANEIGNGLVCVNLTVNGQSASFTGEAGTIMRLIEQISNL